MSSVTLLSFLLTVICCVITLTVMPAEPRAIVSFKKNLNQVYKEWNCKDPKPKLVYLDDEYADYNPSAIYLPHAAVVNRCGKSVGCCKNGQVCTVAEEEQVSFVFEEIVHGKKERKEIVLVNHLRCECQSSSADSPR